MDAVGLEQCSEGEESSRNGEKATRQGVHMDQGTEKKESQHQGPFGCGVDGVWFPQPGESPSNSSSCCKGGCGHFPLGGMVWGLLVKLTLSSCCWQFLDMMGEPDLGMIFTLHDAPPVKLGLWESLPLGCWLPPLGSLSTWSTFPS